MISQLVKRTTNPWIIEFIGFLLCYGYHICRQVNGGHKHVVFLAKLNINMQPH